MNPNAAGGLYETEFDRHHLGRFHGRELTAIVRRRRLRIALGRQRALRLELGEARPVTIEVRALAANDTPERIDVPRVPDPRLQLVQRIAILSLASLLVLWIGRRVRHTDSTHVQHRGGGR